MSYLGIHHDMIAIEYCLKFMNSCCLSKYKGKGKIRANTKLWVTSVLISFSLALKPVVDKNSLLPDTAQM